MMADLKDKNGDLICWKDCETMRLALEPFGVTDTGPIENQNMYIINNDATIKKVNKVMANIHRRIKENKQTRYFVIYVLASHGMVNGGQQMIVLNEFNKASGFYKIFGIEAKIRLIASECPNSYQIALFACCREIMT